MSSFGRFTALGLLWRATRSNLISYCWCCSCGCSRLMRILLASQTWCQLALINKYYVNEMWSSCKLLRLQVTMLFGIFSMAVWQSGHESPAIYKVGYRLMFGITVQYLWTSTIVIFTHWQGHMQQHTWRGTCINAASSVQLFLILLRRVLRPCWVKRSRYRRQRIFTSGSHWKWSSAAIPVINYVRYDDSINLSRAESFWDDLSDWYFSSVELLYSWPRHMFTPTAN